MPVVIRNSREYWVYPSNDPARDVPDVQRAIDEIETGGTIVLKQTAEDGDGLTPFDFGIDGYLQVTRDLRIVGEVTTRAGNWIDTGTTIHGGRQMICGGAIVGDQLQPHPVTISIRDIVFDGFHGGAIRVAASRGNSDITGCTFRNFQEGLSVVGGFLGAFPIVAGYGENPDLVGGRLDIARNHFGAPPAQMTRFNNLMHFSHCNLELVIEENRIDDVYWVGFAVFGNMGFTRIVRNDIRKTLTRPDWDGGAITFGMRPATFLTRNAYDGGAEIRDNRIDIRTPNTSGIAVVQYPREFYDRYPDDPESLSVTVSGNVITMTGNQRAALACMGACSGSEWMHNVVGGSGRQAILVSPAIPVPGQPAPTARPSDNRFTGNRFAGGMIRLPQDLQDQPVAAFTASAEQVLIEAGALRTELVNNEFGPVDGTNPGYPQTVVAAGLRCNAESSRIMRNDFAHSMIPGWDTPIHVGCIYLGSASRANTVLGTSEFPAGTEALHQIADAAPVGANQLVGIPVGVH